MRYKTDRVIEPEILDDQPPEIAAPSLRDIVRINRLSGARRILFEMLQSSGPLKEDFTFLDVGAGSGDLAAAVKQRFPRARVVSLDYRIHHVRRAPSPQVTADAFRLPFPPKTFDLVHCALFLHHFTGAEIVQLLHQFGTIARQRVLVNDLERHWIPYYFLPLTRFIYRWDPITLHDGPISVQAAFHKQELRDLALAAELKDVDVRAHRPAFRLALTASPQG